MRIKTSIGSKHIHALLVFGIALILSLASCTGYKKVEYFKDVPDTLQSPPMEVVHQPFTEPKIQPNDILNVNITTLDPNTTAVFKQSVTQENNTDKGIGYMVNKNGQIDLPIVGLIDVAGLTTAEAADLIRTKAGKYYKSPGVNIQFANFYFVALGDVQKPGRHYVANEKVSIIDAIGMASDLQISGKRDNVLLIREEDGKKVFIRFDLGSTNIFTSPYYYLKTGDVIYVQPNKSKSRGATADATTVRYFSYLISLFSLSISLISILSK